MATDKILVDRETDGKRCGECHRTYDGESYPYCDIFGERVPGGKFRCPSCLATPSARVLTPEMVVAVGKTIGTIEHMLKEHMVHIEANALVGLMRSVEGLRAAFQHIEEVGR